MKKFEKIWRVIYSVVIVVFASFLSLVCLNGVVYFMLFSPKPLVGCLSFLVSAVAMLLAGIGVVLRKRRLCKNAGWMILGAVVMSGCFYGWRWWIHGRYPVVEQEVRWWDYNPKNAENLLVEATIPEEMRLSGAPYPKIDGALALYPVYAAMVAEMYPFYVQGRDYCNLDGSDVIYERLLDEKVDMIFALAPSKKQQEDAEARGLTYELTPFCQEAFVFYVNAKNPVETLTTEQIRGIYSGAITNWREIDERNHEKIIPFQRNEGSGSQTTLLKLMGDTPVMPPLKEDRVGGMGGIIHDTANYRNFKAALGFSFRFYATELLQNNQIKLLSIDGVAPTVENIVNGSYPLIATAYIVTVKPRTENVRKIVDYMVSPEGQSLVQKTGYVPVGPTAE